MLPVLRAVQSQRLIARVQHLNFFVGVLRENNWHNRMTFTKDDDTNSQTQLTPTKVHMTERPDSPIKSVRSQPPINKLQRKQQTQTQDTECSREMRMTRMELGEEEEGEEEEEAPQ